MTEVKDRTLTFFSAVDLSGHQDSHVIETDTPPSVEVTMADASQSEVLNQGLELFAGHFVNRLFDFGGLHLGFFDFEPGLPLVLHSHALDCVYYIERGSIIMGNRELKAGEGFLVPGGHPYGYVVGPKGLRVIEFSHGPHTDLNVLERDPGKWFERLTRAVEERDDS